MTCMDLGFIVPELILAATGLLLVPLAGWVPRRWSSLPTFGAALGLLAALAAGATMVGWDTRQVFCATYAVDGLAVVFKLILITGALITLALFHSYFQGRHPMAHAPVCLVFVTLGSVGLAGAVDLALIVLFLQMISLAAYLLVALDRTSRAGNEASYKIFIYAAIALAIMAYGLTFLYGLTGSLNLVTIGTVLTQGQVDPVWVWLAVSLVLVGYAFEATLVPFHFWAPDVYQGATAPVAGFLSVVPKLAGFAGLIRFLELVLRDDAVWPIAIAVLAGITMTWGNLAALRQQRLKRLLAYSSIAQAGYVLMAVAVGGSAAAGYYLAAYLFMNLAAFAVVSRWERSFQDDHLDVLKGIGWSCPASAAVMALALLSLAGIPPLAGFAGKIFLLEATLSAGFIALAVVAAVNMAIALFYYLRILGRMYLTGRPGPFPLPARPGYTLACGLCTLGTLFLGVVPQPLLSLCANLRSLVF